MDELIDVLDKFGNKTGIVKKKFEVKRDGDFHKVVAVCIINDDNEVLIQKRQCSRKIYPNLWNYNVTGHVMSGELPVQTCIREAKEELSVDIKEEQLKYLYTINVGNVIEDSINRLIIDQYIVRMNVGIEDIVIQEDEMSEIKYISFEDLVEIVNSKDSSFTPDWEAHRKLIDIIESEM